MVEAKTEKGKIDSLYYFTQNLNYIWVNDLIFIEKLSFQ